MELQSRSSEPTEAAFIVRLASAKLRRRKIVGYDMIAAKSADTIGHFKYNRAGFESEGCGENLMIDRALILTLLLDWFKLGKHLPLAQWINIVQFLILFVKSLERKLTCKLIKSFNLHSSATCLPLTDYFQMVINFKQNSDEEKCWSFVFSRCMLSLVLSDH